MARKWRDTVNRQGGNVTVVHLPEIGVHGPDVDLSLGEEAGPICCENHRKASASETTG
jgi:hypothetical protein